MTDEQFEKIMKKLDELKTYQPNPYLPPAYPPSYQNDLQRQLNDGLPHHWTYQARD